MFCKLFYEFFKTGLFSFGGGYATLPFLYHISETYGWFSTKQLSNIIAVSSITPGPLGVNAATFSGYTAFGILGAFTATAAVILPSYIIVIIVYKLLEKFRTNKHIQAALYAIKPAGCGLLSAAGIQIFSDNVTSIWAFVLFAVLMLLFIGKKCSPVAVLGVSAILGVVFGLMNFL